MSVARDHDLKVIEDCAQAHGAGYKGSSVGTIGHVGAWSFCQDKIMTTGGEGGMVTCSEEATWSRMWSFKDHGKSWDAVYNREHPPGFRWVHESIGTNWRMLEMQAAIGRIQLRKMTEWTARRTQIATQLRNEMLQFSDCPCTGTREGHHSCLLQAICLCPSERSKIGLDARPHCAGIY